VGVWWRRQTGGSHTSRRLATHQASRAPGRQWSARAARLVEVPVEAVLVVGDGGHLRFQQHVSMEHTSEVLEPGVDFACNKRVPQTPK